MPPIHPIAAALLAALCVLTAVPAVAGAQSTTEPTPEFAISLTADGDGDVQLTLTYDLTTDAARTAFERLRENETARQQFLDEYAAGLDRVARQTSERTGRQMDVSAASMTLTTTDDTGVVRLSAVWSGLATVDDERLVLADPFDSGFDVDRRFVVRAPAGYAFTSVAPDATVREAARVEWAPGASLDGMRLVAAPVTEASSPTPGVTTANATGEESATSPSRSSADGAGFGVAAAVVCVVLVAALVRRR